MKYIQYIVIFAILGILTGCEDFVEIDPVTQTPAEDALTTGANLEAALFSSYEQIAADAFLGGRVMFYSILLGDNYVPEFAVNATEFTGQVILRNVNEVNVEVDEVWSSGYRAIARANDVIAAVDNGLITDGSSPAFLDQMKGEALFIRGVAHFEIVRLFAQPYSNNPASDLGIPIRVEALTEDVKLSSATVADVYSQVLTDLNDALGLLPATNLNRANQEVARAYLARVYFNMLDYENAFTVANELLESTQVTFSGTPLTPFRNSGNLVPQGGVFFQIVADGNFFGSFRPSAISYNLSTGTGGILTALEESGEDDFRLVEGTTAPDDPAYTLKWDENNINRPVIRLAEVHLVRAESALLKSNVDESTAQQSFDAVRGNSVDPYTPTTLTGQDLLNAIRNERRIELYMEGDRYHELRRLRSEGFGGIDGLREDVPFNDPSLPLEIPFSETSGS